MISLDRLAAAIGDVEETDIPLLEDLRDAAVAFIETQTRRYFGPVTATTEWYRGNGTRSLWLNNPAIVDDDNELTVNEYTHPGATPGEIILDASDGYERRTHGTDVQLVRTGSGGVWTRDYDYAVTYSRGYVENKGPKDIEYLLIELVRLRWNAIGEEVMKSETIAGYSYTRFDSGDIDSIEGGSVTLEAWRRLVFA